MNTDACIGRIRDHLRKAGLEKNTLLMVSSDHGPGHYSGPERKAIANQMKVMEKQGHFSRGPWRGYKFSGYEGGLRVPFAAVWPGVIRPGTENDALVGLVDLMATWAGVAGVKLDPSQAPDSLSFLPYLKNQEILVRNQLVARGTRADVYYEGDWKLILGPGSGSSGPFYTEPKSEDAWKQALAKFGRNPKNHKELEDPTFVQLYDLKTDPGETNNLAKTHFGQVKKMIKAYKKIMEDGRSTPGPKLSNDRPLKIFRPPGFIWKK
jgi:arylsulfatase A-like enzyme